MTDPRACRWLGEGSEREPSYIESPSSTLFLLHGVFLVQHLSADQKKKIQVLPGQQHIEKRSKVLCLLYAGLGMIWTHEKLECRQYCPCWNCILVKKMDDSFESKDIQDLALFHTCDRRDRTSGRKRFGGMCQEFRDKAYAARSGDETGSVMRWHFP